MGKGQDLLEAARKGDQRTVEKVLSQITRRGFPFPSLTRRDNSVNFQGDDGFTPLHHACLHGHREIVKMLLVMDASPCAVDKKGATPLHMAAWKGDSDIVSMLLEHNNPPVDVNHVTHDNDTALLMAARSGYFHVVAQLLQRGADASIRNYQGESALDLAAQFGRLQTVKHLIQVQPILIPPYKFPHWKVQRFSTTPLHRASQNGHLDVVQVLLEAGIDPNIRTSSGTPLHEAACFGKDTVVRILLEYGADLRAVDGKNNTVEDLLADYSEEATSRVRAVIREYKSMSRNHFRNDLPPFPVQDYSPTGYPHDHEMKAPETQKSTNLSDSLFTPSSSFLTKNPHQSFVKKLATKLGIKAKFNSAPNISNTTGLGSNADNKIKQFDSKLNAVHIGNSKFFKILSRKEESGDIGCNDEFDTISLDRLGTINRDSTVNRSNRSCPGFKTSLPNISENNEQADETIDKREELVGSDCDHYTDQTNLAEAVNDKLQYNIFEPRAKSNRLSITSNNSIESANSVNECYESYEFSISEKRSFGPVLSVGNKVSSPKPSPRSKQNVEVLPNISENAIYENLHPEKTYIPRPTPAIRTHIPVKPPPECEKPKSEFENKRRVILYDNVVVLAEKPEPLKKKADLPNSNSNDLSPRNSRSSLSSSSLSSDSMTDEADLEDILMSEKSRSFRHGQKLLIHKDSFKSSIHRTQSSESNFTDITVSSAIENVDYSDDVNVNTIYLSMVGTLPTKKHEKTEKKVLFRNKTFTNIEVDRNSLCIKSIPRRKNSFRKETLAHYHIRGTGHCIYESPTVQDFIYIFNRNTLYTDIEPFTKIPNENKRDSYFETAICFCKPMPDKHHCSAEDLLDIPPQDDDAKVSIDMTALRDKIEMVSTSFRCFCDSGTCALHASRRATTNNLVVKFSALKRSISTPDITLLPSSDSIAQRSRLVKNKSVPSNLEEPYAVVNITDIIERNDKSNNSYAKDLDSPIYIPMSPHSSLSSAERPYSIKDIAEVISIGTNSRSTDTNPFCVSSSMHLPLRKSSSSGLSGHWSLQSCNSNNTIISDTSFQTCFEGSSDDGSDATLHSDEESSDAETVKSDVSITKRPWVHSNSFRFDNRNSISSVIEEEPRDISKLESPSKFESGISVQSSESSSSECEDDSGVPGLDADVSLNASLERVSGMVGGVSSGSGRRRWDEAEGASEGDALSISSAASSCAPMHLAHRHEYCKVSPTPPKKPPRRNLSVSPTHVNSPSSGYSYELRTHARSQDDLDDIQGAKHYLKHGRSVDQYVDGKLSYSEYEENHNSPRVVPEPNPRPSLKNRTQPVAITAMYENVVIKEQNPRRKLRRGPQCENFETRMADKRIRMYSNQERSSLESLLDDQSVNSPSDCERYCDGPRLDVPMSPTNYEQPPTPDHPPPSAKQAENSIHERIRPLSQLIMEVVEEIRIRQKSQGDVANS